MKRIIAILLTLVICFSLMSISTSALGQQIIGGKMYVEVTVPYGDQIEDKVDHFEILNEKGNKIKILEVEKRYDSPSQAAVYGIFTLFSGDDMKESNHTATFTIYFSVLTAGSRVFTIRAITKSGQIYGDPISYYCTVRAETTTNDILSASFEAPSVERNQPVLATVVTGSQVKGINFYNEKNAKMGKSLVSKTQNPDGSRVWTYSMTIGTAGENRTFTAIADGNVEKSATLSINVTK